MKLRNPQTGIVHEVSDAEAGAAVAEGYAPVTEAEGARAELFHRGKVLSDEEGLLGSAKNLSHSAARSIYDLGAAAPRLMGVDVDSAGENLEALGIANDEDARARAAFSGTEAAIGSILPDVAALALSGGSSAALSAGGKMGARKLAATALREAAMGAAAGASIEDELAWQEGREANADERLKGAFSGGLLGGGLSVGGRLAGDAIGAGKSAALRDGGLLDSIATKGIEKGGASDLLKKGANIATGGKLGAAMDAFDILGGSAKKATRAADDFAQDAARASAKIEKEAAAMERKAAAATKKAEAKRAASVANREAGNEAGESLSKRYRSKGERLEADYGKKRAKLEKELKSLDDIGAVEGQRVQKLQKKVAQFEDPNFSGLSEKQSAKLAELDQTVKRIEGSLSNQMRSGKVNAKEYSAKKAQIRSSQKKAAEIRKAGNARRSQKIKEAQQKLKDAETGAAAKRADQRAVLRERLSGIDEEIASRKAAFQKELGQRQKESARKFYKKERKISREAQELEAQAQGFQEGGAAARAEAARVQGEAARMAEEAAVDPKKILQSEAYQAGKRGLGKVADILQGYAKMAYRPHIHAIALTNGRDYDYRSDADSAIMSIIDGDGFKPRKLTPIALGQYQSLGSDPKTAYIANSEMIQKIASDPTLLMSEIDDGGALAALNPEADQMRQERIANAVRVMSEYGKPFTPDSLTGAPIYTASTSEALAYKDAWETAFNPQKSINDFAGGTLTEEKWTITQEVYPEIAESMQFSAMEALTELNPTLSPTQRAQFHTIMGTTDPMYSGQYQAAFDGAVQSAQPKGPTPPRPTGQTSPQEIMRSTGTLSQQSQVGASY